MDVMHARCGGLDVHQQTVVACARLASGRSVTYDVRTFGTTTPELLALSDWLTTHGCTHVAMESTGVYWKPVWQVLDGSFELVLANAMHIRNIPGRKTDVNDATWIADLLAHGLIRGSFVPPAPVQELRDLTRTRKQLVREIAQRYGPNEAAVIWQDGKRISWTYADLLARAMEVARALVACGVGKGTRVGLLNTNRLEFLAGLQQARRAEGTHRFGGCGGNGGQCGVGGEADARQQQSTHRTKKHSLHRFSFWMRSDGVMMSVRRMPNFSLTTTTSPCAIRVPLTSTSSGSPAIRSSSTTEPWFN